MKRYIIVILMFAIISVSSTAIMIYIKNNTQTQTNEIEIINKPKVDEVITVGLTENKVNTVNEVTPTPTPTIKTNEKTLDLYGVHNENDLIFVEKYMDHSGKEINDSNSTNFRNIKYYEISGLKDKTIENKINKKIKEKIYNFSKEFLEISGISDCHFYCWERSNFSNIISIYFTAYGELGNQEYFDKELGLNFELVTGEELKFEDLFAKTADLNKAPTLGLYRVLAKSSMLGDGRRIHRYIF